MDEDDLFAELCGVTVTDMEVTQEDDGVLRHELCLAVERALIDSRAAQIDAAFDAFGASGTAVAGVTVSANVRLLNALQLGKLICDGEYAAVLRSEQAQRVVDVMANTESAVAAQNGEHIATSISRKLEAFVQSADSEDEGDERLAATYEVLMVGVAFFSLFVQANYTGPALDHAQLEDVIALAARVLLGVDQQAKQRDSSKPTDTLLHREGVLALHVDGESPFTICELPSFLVLGRAVLHFTGNNKFANWSVPVEQFGGHDEDEDVTNPMPTVHDAGVRAVLAQVRTGAWWNARAAVAHERLLIAKDPSNTLWYEARRGFVRTLRDDALFAVPRSEYLHARAYVEWGLAQNYFDKNKQGKRTFEHAKDVSGVAVQLSGSLGKRTKYQQKSVAQMVLLAASKYAPNEKETAPSIYAHAMAESTDAELGGRRVVPDEDDAQPPVDGLTAEEERIQRMVIDGEAAYRDVQLDQVDADNILLEQIAFEDKSMTEQGNLQTIDQVILLALCLDVKNSNANDGLTREEMFPYVTRVLENPNNWMVYSTGLLERAWLECESYKRRERGVLQMQALVDQHTSRLTVLQNSLKAIEDAAPARERMEFVYALAFPPRYALKRDLAERYFKLGVMRSALDICLELEMWDDVVKCYQVLEQQAKAEKLVRERLAIAPSPYMWTCLGDITGEIEHYETAWTLSKQRYARAKRSLGRHFFDAGDYETAIRHYQDSVEVNPMNSGAWFILGTMSMRTQNWTLGLRALTRVVQLEPDNGEAWGNIGSIHLSNGRYAEAFSVLQEALKQKREMWQMWENYAFCAIQIEKYGEAMYAIHQWLDRRGKHKRVVDHELLAWLVESMVYPESMNDATDAKSDERDQDASDAVSAVLLQGLNQDDGEDEDEDLADLDEAALATDKTPPRSNANYKKQLALLFGRVTSITTNNPKIWQVYAHFNDGVGRKEKALDCRLKQCRALQVAGWETEKTSVEELCTAAVRLSQDYMADGSKKALYACRLYIRGVLRKAQVDFGELPACQSLAATLAEVEALEKQLTA